MKNYKENIDLKLKIHPFWMLLSFIARLRDSLFIYVLLNVLSHYIHIMQPFKMPILASYIFISLISIIFYWKNYTIEANEEYILLKKGWAFKIQKKVYLKNIVGYRLNNNILEKLLNLSSLKLTTAEVDSKEGIKIHYIHNKNLKKLLSLMKVENDKQDYLKADFLINKNLLIKKSFSSVSALIFISFAYTLSNQIADFIKIEIPIKEIIAFFKESMLNFILGLSLLYLLSLLFSFIKTFLLYSNFKLFNSDNFIHTNHGILKNNENLIRKDNINVILIQASFLENLLNISKIKVINSFEDEDNKMETNVLTPIINNDKKYEFIHKFLSINMYDKEYNLKRISKYSIIPKIIRTSILWVPLILTLPIINSVIIMIFIYFIIVYVLLSQFLQIFLTKYGYSEVNLNIKKRGLSSSQSLIRFTDIKEISISQSFLQRIFNINSLKIVTIATPPKKIVLHDLNNKHTYNIVEKYKNNCNIE